MRYMIYLLEVLDDVLPGWPVGEVVPPPRNVGALGEDVTVASAGEQSAVGEVLKISQSDLITSKVLLLAKDYIISVKLCLQHSEALCHGLLIGRQTTAWLEYLLECDARREGVEVECLDRRSLFKQRLLLWIGRNETLGSLVGVLLDQVTCNGAGLVEDEAVIIDDVWDLAEWLNSHEARSLVLALAEVNGIEVEGDLLFLADQDNETGAGGVGGAVDCESHDGSMCLWGDLGRLKSVFKVVAE